MLHTLMESQCLLYLDNRINTVMAYTLNLTSSPALVTVTDETLDNTYALTFVGRNRGEWGEVVNENFLRLMENFASSTPPSTSVEGQLHYDTVNKSLAVFNGLAYVTVTNDIDGGTFSWHYQAAEILVLAKS